MRRFRRLHTLIVRWMSVATLPGLIAAAALLISNASPAAAAVTTVNVGQQNGGTTSAFQFNAAAVTLQAPGSVQWNWFNFQHNITSYAETGGVPDWQSPPLNGPGQSYTRQFTQGGTQTYYCTFHAQRDSADPAVVDGNIAAGVMVGKIVVLSPPVGGVSADVDPSSLPAEGEGRPWRILALATAGAVALAAGAFMLRRRSV